MELAIFESVFLKNAAQLSGWQKILRYTQLPGLAMGGALLPVVHAMPGSFTAIGSLMVIVAGLAIEILLFSWLVWLSIAVFAGRR